MLCLKFPLTAQAYLTYLLLLCNPFRLKELKLKISGGKLFCLLAYVVAIVFIHESSSPEKSGA
ncbi:MAG TPA: hypothetical protein VIM59_19950, partial [Cellvibrio sp.]